MGLAGSTFCENLFTQSGLAGQVGVSPLRAVDAQTLSSLLLRDAQDLLYSSLICVADALRGFSAGYYSWGAVKLYYSIFYSTRALMASNRICVFYADNKPFWLLSIAGEVCKRPPASARGSTHKFVFHLFRSNFPNSPLLSQPIGFTDAFEWRMKLREKINYTDARLLEPSWHSCFSNISRGKIRSLVDAYLKEDWYAFDPDHAVLAYPLFNLKYVSKNATRSTVTTITSADENVKLEKYLADKHGPLSALLALKRAILVAP